MNDNEAVAHAIIDALGGSHLKGGGYEDTNAVDALGEIAGALRLLGNADAATPMGALEAHGKTMLEASENIRAGLSDVADAIRESRES